MKTRSIMLGFSSLALVTALAVAAVPAGARPSSPSIVTSPIAWHQVSVPAGTLQTLGQPAMARDAAGNLHVVFLSEPGSSGQYFDAKFGPLGLASGTPTKVFAAPWSSLSNTPTLMSASGSTPMQLEFDGIQGPPGVFSDGCIYGATSTGLGWSLINGQAFSHECTGVVSESATRVASTAETAWNGFTSPDDAFEYHVGSNPCCPTSVGDTIVHLGVGSGDEIDTATALDTTGSPHLAIAGWLEFTTPSDSQDGIYAWDSSLTTTGHVRKAPFSGEVDPIQRVAMVSGSAAHVPFVAYCTGATTCTGVRLWNVDKNTTLSLANSKGSLFVAASAGPAGRLWVAFYRESTNTVTVARTNENATKFGPERVYKAPAFIDQSSLQIQGSAGRLDMVFVGVLSSTLKPAIFHAQVLPPLTLLAGKTSFKGTTGGSITFSVFDAGMPVPGAKVSVLGHSGTTGPMGSVKLTFGKSKTGTYSATAKKKGYIAGALNIHVT